MTDRPGAPAAGRPGTLTVSFDLELAWGEFYRRPVDTGRMLAARRALPALLELLARHRIAATFAVVGHLLLEGCDGHDDLPSARVAWRPGGWFEGDPRTGEAVDPAWYAPSLVRAVRRAEPGHDVGAHGFSHVPLGDPAVTPEVARAELASCARLLGGGPRPLSFVFPRNDINYVELLSAQGFGCYRGVERRWYRRAPRPVRRAAHMADQALGIAPRVGEPLRSGSVIEVPSSMLFLSREGFRRRIPLASRVRRARRGLDRAVRSGRVFHLWMHVEDLVPDTAGMLGALDAVLGDAARRVRAGVLAVRTMAALAEDAGR